MCGSTKAISMISSSFSVPPPLSLSLSPCFYLSDSVMPITCWFSQDLMGQGFRGFLRPRYNLGRHTVPQQEAISEGRGPMAGSELEMVDLGQMGLEEAERSSRSGSNRLLIN